MTSSSSYADASPEELAARRERRERENATGKGNGEEEEGGGREGGRLSSGRMVSKINESKLRKLDGVIAERGGEEAFPFPLSSLSPSECVCVCVCLGKEGRKDNRGTATRKKRKEQYYTTGCPKQKKNPTLWIGLDPSVGYGKITRDKFKQTKQGQCFIGTTCTIVVSMEDGGGGGGAKT